MQSVVEDLRWVEEEPRGLCSCSHGRYRAPRPVQSYRSPCKTSVRGSMEELLKKEGLEKEHEMNVR